MDDTLDAGVVYRAILTGLSTLLIGLVLCCYPFRSAKADYPVPVVVLWETLGSGPPIFTSWPLGLRFVAYDSGVVIYSPDPTEAQDYYRHYILHYYEDAMGPADAQLLGDAIYQKLKSTPQPETSLDRTRKYGQTILQVRDAATNTYRKFVFYGHPCKLSDAKPRPRQSVFRAIADQTLLGICDELSQYQSDSAKPWVPQEMQISLARVPEGSIQTNPWPSDWPSLRPDEQNADKVSFCISPWRNNAVVSEMTRLLASDDLDEYQKLKGVSGYGTWNLPYAKYVLPDNSTWPLWHSRSDAKYPFPVTCHYE